MTANRVYSILSIPAAAGKYVIPGGVDVHVHLELPFCGTVSSDDWNTGTRAAARGGVTTVIDFAIPYGDQSLDDAYHAWLAHDERARVNAELAPLLDGELRGELYSVADTWPHIDPPEGRRP